MAKTAKAKLKKTEVTKAEIINIIPGGKLNNFLNTFPDKAMKFKSSKNFYIAALVVGILLLAIFKKNWFVAAMVNGTPITNLELQSQLNQQFRTQTLTQLINEKVIMMEASKNGALPTQAEINNKITELETTVGGKAALDSLLTQQGQTRTSLINQIKIKLTITKLYEKEASVSSDEVTKFIEENKAQMQATDSASQQKEAYDTIKNQKLSRIFSQKFQELHQKAKIQIF